MSVRALTQLLRQRKLSAIELLDAHLERIASVNSVVNAVVAIDPEQARRDAAAADRLLQSGGNLPPLVGIPTAVKDLEDTAGIRTTYGSPLYRNHVPEADGVMADRLRRAGAIIVGKTNTSEFGAGSQTVNSVYGATYNPYDLSKTAGGSSGGAAVAAATGMVPFADGSDLAASIRNPAGFCNVVGLRPSPGRWPDQSMVDGWDPLAVLGPICRDVGDANFVLKAVGGEDHRSPISLASSSAAASQERGCDLKGARIAWSSDLGDLPVDPRVTAVLSQHIKTFQHLGCRLEFAEPELSESDASFDVLRALSFVGAFGRIVRDHPTEVKETIKWNVERGWALKPEQIADALAARTRAFHTMRRFLERYDALVLPVSQVLPFSIEIEWPRSVAGVDMAHYVEWLRSCSRITMTSHPAVSVPAGFSEEGLPVGLQLVGRYRDEAGLLQLAQVFEEATGFARRRPALAVGMGSDGPRHGQRGSI